MGYGNLGKAVCKKVSEADDMQIVAVFTRRQLKDIDIKGVVVDKLTNVKNYVGVIDVMILCVGSANDLPIVAREILQYFNTVDTYDNHDKIGEYIDSVEQVAKLYNKTSVVCAGWDPGIFSLARGLFSGILTEGQLYTFWGKGVSQGHSQAVRQIDGVEKAVAYTIPNEDAIAQIVSGGSPILKTSQMHKRLCVVVAKANANKEEIAKQIKSIPHYFLPYDTSVQFVSSEEFDVEHTKLFHSGNVFMTSYKDNCGSLAQLKLTLDSNPTFTAGVAVAYARAAHKLASDKQFGAYTVFDIPISYIVDTSLARKLKTLL